MQYSLKDYQKGFELDQARIGQEVAQDWIWPYAYDLDDLLDMHIKGFSLTQTIDIFGIPLA